MCRKHPWRLSMLVVLLGVTGGVTVPLVVSTLSAVAEGARSSAADLETADPAAVGVSVERLARLDAGMQRMVDEGKLAGIVTLLARHGKLVFADVVGHQNVSAGVPMARDSIFKIYSMTKPITGVALMMLYEEGKFRLHDPVSKYIPELANLQVHVGDTADGRPKLEDANRSMTMAELMSHGGGFAYGLGPATHVDRLYLEHDVLNLDTSMQTMIDKLSTLPLLAQPGTRWYYSIGVDVQGYLVEKLSGQPFADFLQTRIFDPLGMVDTAFYVPPEKIDRVALTYGIDNQGQFEAIDQADPGAFPYGYAQMRTETPGLPSGGGGLWGTADDYLRFTQMLLNGGELDGVRLLAPRTVEMMRTNHLSAEALPTMRPGTGFGLDFAVVHDPNAAGEPYAQGSYYWGGAAGTWFWIDPATDLTFVGMIQFMDFDPNDAAVVQEVQGISRNLVYQAVTAP